MKIKNLTLKNKFNLIDKKFLVQDILKGDKKRAFDSLNSKFLVGFKNKVALYEVRLVKLFLKKALKIIFAFAKKKKAVLPLQLPRTQASLLKCLQRIQNTMPHLVVALNFPPYINFPKEFVRNIALISVIHARNRQEEFSYKILGNYSHGVSSFLTGLIRKSCTVTRKRKKRFH